MNSSKVKDWYEKYHLLVTLIVSTLILALSTIWYPALYISAIVVAVSFIFYNIEDICAAIFYFMFFSGFTAFFVVVAVGAFVTIFIKYAIDAYNRKVKFHKELFFWTTVIVVIFSIIHYKVNEYGFYIGLLLDAFLYLIYVIFCYHRQLSIKRMFSYLFLGLVISAIMAGVLSVIPASKVFMFYDWEFVFRPVKDKLFMVYGTQYRIELFTYHPNHLACYCMMMIAYGIYSLINYNNSKKDIVFNFVMILVSAIAGFLTLSKAFYFLFIVELIYVIAYLIYKYRSKSLNFILPLLLVVIALGLIFHNQLLETIKRLFPSDNVNLSDITSGRTGIWKKYLQDIFSSLGKVLFGEGVFTNELVEIGPHNFYLMLLFRFGLVGIALLVTLAVFYVKTYDGKILLDWKRALPLIIIMLYAIQEANNDERFFLMIMSVILMFQTNLDDQLYGFAFKYKRPRTAEKLKTAAAGDGLQNISQSTNNKINNNTKNENSNNTANTAGTNTANNTASNNNFNQKYKNFNSSKKRKKKK